MSLGILNIDNGSASFKKYVENARPAVTSTVAPIDNYVRATVEKGRPHQIQTGIFLAQARGPVATKEMLQSEQKPQDIDEALTMLATSTSSTTRAQAYGYLWQQIANNRQSADHEEVTRRMFEIVESSKESKFISDDLESAIKILSYSKEKANRERFMKAVVSERVIDALDYEPAQKYLTSKWLKGNDEIQLAMNVLKASDFIDSNDLLIMLFFKLKGTDKETEDSMLMDQIKYAVHMLKKGKHLTASADFLKVARPAINIVDIATNLLPQLIPGSLEAAYATLGVIINKLTELAPLGDITDNGYNSLVNRTIAALGLLIQADPGNMMKIMEIYFETIPAAVKERRNFSLTEYTSNVRSIIEKSIDYVLENGPEKDIVNTLEVLGSPYMDSGMAVPKLRKHLYRRETDIWTSAVINILFVASRDDEYAKNEIKKVCQDPTLAQKVKNLLAGQAVRTTTSSQSTPARQSIELIKLAINNSDTTRASALNELFKLIGSTPDPKDNKKIVKTTFLWMLRGTAIAYFDWQEIGALLKKVYGEEWQTSVKSMLWSEYNDIGDNTDRARNYIRVVNAFGISDLSNNIVDLKNRPELSAELKSE